MGDGSRATCDCLAHSGRPSLTPCPTWPETAVPAHLPWRRPFLPTCPGDGRSCPTWPETAVPAPPGQRLPHLPTWPGDCRSCPPGQRLPHLAWRLATCPTWPETAVPAHLPWRLARDCPTWPETAPAGQTKKKDLETLQVFFLSGKRPFFYPQSARSYSSVYSTMLNARS